MNNFLWKIFDEFLDSWACYISYFIITLFLIYNWNHFPSYTLIFILIFMIYPSFYNIKRAGIWNGFVDELLQITKFFVVCFCIYLLFRAFILVFGMILALFIAPCMSSDLGNVSFEKEIKVFNMKTHKVIYLNYYKNNVYRDYSYNFYYKNSFNTLQDSHGNIYQIL